MGWTAAAVIGSAVIGGIASSKAASAQKSAAAQAGQISEAQYQQNREDQAPYRNLGEFAAKELGALYGNGMVINQDGSPVGNGNAMFDRLPQNLRDRMLEFRRRFGGEVMTNPGTINHGTVTPLSAYGRNGDTELAHVSPGEAVVPREVFARPGVQNALAAGFQQEGLDPSRYVVGGRNSVNPNTGLREYYSGGSAGGMDTIGADFDRSFPGRERDLGGRGDGKDPTDINRYVMRNPSQGVAGVAPVGQTVPDDYYTQENAMARFYESPDYRINFDEGANALERSAAARGGLFSGNTGTALVRYGQDYGNRLYNQYANRLASFAGLGQNAAAQTGATGVQVAGQRGNALMYGGNAAAQGWENLANSVNAGIGNALYYNYMNG